MTYFLIVFSILFNFSAFSQSKTMAQEVVICKSPGKVTEIVGQGKTIGAGKSVRTLRVYESKDNIENGNSVTGCKATYSKTNSEQVVGTSRVYGQCQAILNGIQKNLEASNWTCRRAAGAMSVLKSNAVEANDESISEQSANSESVVR